MHKNLYNEYFLHLLYNNNNIFLYDYIITYTIVEQYFFLQNAILEFL